MHPVDTLFTLMSAVKPYPDGVIPVPDRIPGVAFFPGGAGLWGVVPGAPLPPMPVGGVMVLGHDFHSESGFRASFRQGSEVPTSPTDGYRSPPTWTTLRTLLKEAGIPEERCFFTNAYMGLRKGEGTTGRFPGSRDPGFVKRCREFLVHQLDVQRPTVILTLGTWVPSFIAELSPELQGWRKVGSMAGIDGARALHHHVSFSDVPGLDCSVVALTHPSLRGPNVGRRIYGDFTGHAAELEMLAEVRERVTGASSA